MSCVKESVCMCVPLCGVCYFRNKGVCLEFPVKGLKLRQNHNSFVHIHPSKFYAMSIFFRWLLLLFSHRMTFAEKGAWCERANDRVRERERERSVQTTQSNRKINNRQTIAQSDFHMAFSVLKTARICETFECEKHLISCFKFKGHTK